MTLFAAATAEEVALDLPAGVLSALIAQESGGDPFAIRYEPAFFDTYIRHATRKGLGGMWPGQVSEDTERMARAMSWGLCQVMGQVAREFGFAEPFLSALCDPARGIHFGALVLHKKLTTYGNLPDALSAYNAGHPSAQNRDSYVAPILARMA